MTRFPFVSRPSLGSSCGTISHKLSGSNRTLAWRPSVTKRRCHDSVRTEGKSAVPTTDGLRHFSVLCQLVHESCCCAMHSPTILPSLRLPTQDSVQHFGRVAALAGQPNQRTCIGRTTPDRQPSTVTCTRACEWSWNFWESFPKVFWIVKEHSYIFPWSNPFTQHPLVWEESEPT